MSEALARLRRNNVKQKILEGLNEQQRKPVVDYVGASIVLAGAGSGKTHTIVSRTAYMIEDGVPARSILLFTFTRKGADEIKARVQANIGTKANDVTVGTYHSFCARLLRRNIEVFKVWNRNFSIYDTEDSQSILKDIIKGSTGEAAQMKPQSAAAVISAWKEKMFSPTDAAAEAAEEGDSFKGMVADIYHEYSQILRAQNALDFDDLIYVVIRMFEQFPEIKEQVNSRYQYVVADESQDSSPRDLELIYHLGGTSMNICLVGDDYQAIYGFRGSDIEVFFDFVKDYKLKKFFLDQNYRSTQTIVNAAQSLVDHNDHQFEKHLFSENPVGTQIVSYALPDATAEALQVTRIVKALHRNGYDLKDIAILYRMQYLSRKVEDAFIANNIHYRMLSGTPFYARKEIKDVVAYLRLLLNPSDQVAFERVVNRPKRGIGASSLGKINACIYGEGYGILTLKQMKQNLKDLVLRGKAKKGIDNFFEILSQLNEQKSVLRPVDLVDLVIHLTGYLKFIQEEDEDSYEERKANVEELRQIAEAYDSLEDFIGNMTVNETTAEDDPEDVDQVNMLTSHGSKGLEFKAVIVVGCNQGIFPHFKAIIDGDISEERRLFYVSMTRAKELLFLTRAKVMERNGIPTAQAPSAFLREVDSKYLRQL